MRILLTNDDGIHAKGIKVLEDIARQISEDVWIIAPIDDQSGVSHSLTLREPFRINTISERHYSVTGTPTDCVMVAKHYLMKDCLPDLVLSGVNYGANLAEDVTYSGTIAAAIEATLLGIPAIALSMVVENKKIAKWSTVEHWAPNIIKKLLAQKWSEGVFISINFPNVSHNTVNGIMATEQGQRFIYDNIVERVDPRGNPYYWIGAGNHRYEDIWRHAKPGTDLEAIGNKFISITPLSLNLTHNPTKSKLKELFENA